jgi:hypothetical protein
MQTLEQRWNKQKIVNDTFAACPTKAKMPEDYAMNIHSALSQGGPENDVKDCHLLFACACGTMLGFHGNQVCCGLFFFVCVCVCVCVRFVVIEIFQLTDFAFVGPCAFLVGCCVVGMLWPTIL